MAERMTDSRVRRLPGVVAVRHVRYGLVDIAVKAAPLPVAGVLVGGGRERQLTSSWYNWKDQASDSPRKFGQTDAEAQRISRASQVVTDGQVGTTASTAVSFVKERMEIPSPSRNWILALI